MTNTRTSFSDKWDKNKDLAILETLREGSDIFNWILTRNGFTCATELGAYLRSKKRIIDAGCGNGRVTALLRKYSDPATTHVMGIDLVAAHVAKENAQKLGLDANTSFSERDLLGDLKDLGKFDFIYCQEVLHHTKDPRAAFNNLVGLLDKGGEIAIYVYKKKAPVREFVDDYVRDRIAGLPYDDAIKATDQITALGKALSELNMKVNIPAVDLLEIKEGEYDLQRFVYHFFMKCFWNPELSFKDNSVINYDWYHPQLCSRHTVEEIREWFKSAGLAIAHECVDFYGITMRGRVG